MIETEQFERPLKNAAPEARSDCFCRQSSQRLGAAGIKGLKMWVMTSPAYGVQQREAPVLRIKPALRRWAFPRKAEQLAAKRPPGSPDQKVW